MPPTLHPRSRMTMSLFTSTLLFSFLIVGTPHLLPCPVDPRARADSADPDALSARPRKRRRKVQSEEDRAPTSCSGKDLTSHESSTVDPEDKIPRPEERRRECPVPKPGGLMGQILGVKKEDDGKRMPVVVKVEPVRRMKERIAEGPDSENPRSR